jgi:hypothetical protein
VYIIPLASGINQQINKYFIDMIKAKCLPWDFFYAGKDEGTTNIIKRSSPSVVCLYEQKCVNEHR